MRGQGGRDPDVEADEADDDFGDPEPRPSEASAEEKVAYHRDVVQYSEEMLACLKETGATTGNEL